MTILTILTCLRLNAAGEPAVGGISISAGRDSLLPVRGNYERREEIAEDLLDAEADYSRTGDGKRAYTRLLRVLKLKRAVREGRAGYRFYNNLAVFSARLKMYPLAMKCYSRALECRTKDRLSVYQLPEEPEDSLSYGSMLDIDSSGIGSGHPGESLKSYPVLVRDILTAFEDGKEGVAYAMMVHVKQPIPGRRKAFTHFNNVGHMFITLIKYNADNSVVSRSFGFYPHKKNIFSATPLDVRTPSVIKDDSGHDWDELIGKYISAERFSKILGVLQRCEGMVYNLNRNNCTDFGLQFASTAGIGIRETRGHWPLGKGNNPANAGQSILEGKFSDLDHEKALPLFSALFSPLQ